MSTLLNSFCNNLSTVLSTSEVRTLQSRLEFYGTNYESEEEVWSYLSSQNQEYILNNLGLPACFEKYPWSVDEKIRELLALSTNQITLTLLWKKLGLEYEQLLEVQDTTLIIVQESSYWRFLWVFKTIGYILSLFNGGITQQELDEAVKLHLLNPDICSALSGEHDDFYYIVSLLKKERYIASYSTKIENFVGNPTDSIYLGVELEILYQDLNIESLYSYNKEGEIALLKKDSSIEGQGFEIVTCAMSLDYQLTYWREIIEQFGSELTPHSSCGMHVHISRQPLSQLQIGKILVFLNDPANDWYVSAIAGRAANDYCDRKPKKLEDVSCPQSRYEALNLTNDSTIEFRLFASTNNYYLIASRIEFCHALTKYCENAELTKLQWADFKEWVIQEDNPLYSHLKKWLTINS